MHPLRGLVAVYRDAFSGLPRPVWWLSLALLVNRAGTMVLPFLSLYLTRELGLSLTSAGRLIGFFGLGSVLGSWLGGQLSDRIGPVRVQVVSLFATGAGFVALIGQTRPWTIAVTMFLVGALGDAFRPAMMTATARLSPPAVRTRAFALMRLAANAGMAIGPAVGGWLATRSYDWLFVGDAVTCWAAAALLLLRLGPVPEASTPDRRRRTGPTSSPWRDGPYLTFLGLVTVLALTFFQVFTTLPLHLREGYGLGEESIGSLIALNALIIVLFEMVILRRLETRSPARIAAWGALCIGAGLAVLPLGPPVWIAVGSTVVWTLGEMLALPMANVVAAHRAEGGPVGSYMGAFMITFAVGLVLAPVLGTELYARGGPGLLWSVAGVAGAGVGLGFWRIAHRLERPTTLGGPQSA